MGGKEGSVFDAWCFQNDRAAESTGAEGVSCDSSGKSQTSLHTVGQELLSFWQAFQSNLSSPVCPD